MKLSDDWKNKLKVAANSNEVKNMKQSTCFDRYGTKNPGVLGAYSSKSARDYIVKLLAERNIDLNKIKKIFHLNTNFFS